MTDRHHRGLGGAIRLTWRWAIEPKQIYTTVSSVSSVWSVWLWSVLR